MTVRKSWGNRDDVSTHMLTWEDNISVIPPCCMRTFAMAAATLWNSLNVRDRGNRIRGSTSLESFKSNLKTLLFKEHFYPFSS